MTQPDAVQDHSSFRDLPGRIEAALPLVSPSDLGQNSRETNTDAKHDPIRESIL